MYFLSGTYFDIIEVVDPEEKEADEAFEIAVEKIKDAIPELSGDVYDDFEKTCAIRDWAYKKIIYSGDIDTIDIEYSTRHTSEWNLMKFNEAFEQFRGGGYCGGCAQYLYCVYEALGYDTCTLSLSINEKATHVTTLVYVDDKWIVQDATFNYTIIDEDGIPLSIQEIVRDCAEKKICDMEYSFGDTALRYVVYTNEQDVVPYEKFEPNTLECYPLYEADISVDEDYIYLSNMEQPKCFEWQVEDILEDRLVPFGYSADLENLFLFPGGVYGDDRRACDMLLNEINEISDHVKGE